MSRQPSLRPNSAVCKTHAAMVAVRRRCAETFVLALVTIGMRFVSGAIVIQSINPTASPEKYEPGPAV